MVFRWYVGKFVSQFLTFFGTNCSRKVSFLTENSQFSSQNVLRSENHFFDFFEQVPSTNDDTETPDPVQAQIPSHPGIKYPVRGIPPSDLDPSLGCYARVGRGQRAGGQEISSV